MRGHHAGVHHVNHGTGPAIAAAILAVEETVALIDPVEMPEEIGGRLIAATDEAGGGVIAVERNLHFAAVSGDHRRFGCIRRVYEHAEREYNGQTAKGLSQKGAPGLSVLPLDDARKRVHEPAGEFKINLCGL